MIGTPTWVNGLGIWLIRSIISMRFEVGENGEVKKVDD